MAQIANNMSVFRSRRSKNDFLDQEKWPKGWKPVCHSQAKWYHYDCS